MIRREHALEGKFSMEFAMACALIGGRAGVEQLRDDFVNRSDVQALMKRVVGARIAFAIRIRSEDFRG